MGTTESAVNNGRDLPKSRDRASAAASFFLSSSISLESPLARDLDDIFASGLEIIIKDKYWKKKGRKGTDLLFQLCVLALCVDQVQDDVECASEHERKKEAEAGQVCVPLRAEEGSQREHRMGEEARQRGG